MTERPSPDLAAEQSISPEAASAALGFAQGTRIPFNNRSGRVVAGLLLVLCAATGTGAVYSDRQAFSSNGIVGLDECERRHFHLIADLAGDGHFGTEMRSNKFAFTRADMASISALCARFSGAPRVHDVGSRTSQDAGMRANKSLGDMFRQRKDQDKPDIISSTSTVPSVLPGDGQGSKGVAGDAADSARGSSQ